MDTNTLSPEVAAATIAPAHAGNRNLSTNPKRMAVIKVRNAMFRGARKYVESEHFLAVHNMPRIVGVTGIRQSMKLEDFEWNLSFHEENEVALHSGAGVGMARVAQFILGQTDIRDCVPFLINRENVI